MEMEMRLLFVALLGSVLMLGCVSAPRSFSNVDQMLDDFHKAAADSNEKKYFSYFTDKAVFLGTDAKERWTKEEFRKYVKPHFKKGKGWKYKKLIRHISIEEDGMIAWFDEKLFNKKYGECRGTGVLLRHGSQWKIAQYSLTIPIPNELTTEITKKIRKKRRR